MFDQLNVCLGEQQRLLSKTFKNRIQQDHQFSRKVKDLKMT